MDLQGRSTTPLSTPGPGSRAEGYCGFVLWLFHPAASTYRRHRSRRLAEGKHMCARGERARLLAPASGPGARCRPDLPPLVDGTTPVPKCKSSGPLAARPDTPSGVSGSSRAYWASILRWGEVVEVAGGCVMVIRPGGSVGACVGCSRTLTHPLNITFVPTA